MRLQHQSIDEDADRHVQCHILRHHKQACQGERACFPGLLHWCFKGELDLLKHFRVRSKNAARGPSQPVLSHAVQTFCIQHCSVTVVLVLDLVLVLLLLLRLLLLVAYLALLMIMLMLVRPPFSCANGQLHQAVTSSKLPGL